MSAARYWRIWFGTVVGVARFAEVEMRTTIGGADQCTGGTAIGSSGTPANAFDDNTGTEWVATVDSVSFIGYDFGAGNDKDIVEFVLRTSGSLPAASCGAFTLQSSPDNSVWTPRSVRYAGYAYTANTATTITRYTSADVTTRVASRTAAAYFAAATETTGPYTAIPTNGVVNGQVLEGTTPVPYARVMAYNRASGELIRKAICDANGYFAMPGFDPRTPAAPDQGKYFVVALDPQGGVLYNALIADRVVPQLS